MDDDGAREGLGQLRVPTLVLAWAGLGSAEQGELDIALALMARAVEKADAVQRIELLDSLERLVEVTIESGEIEAADRAVELLSHSAESHSLVSRVVQLRVTDLRSTTAAERSAVDREVRQLQHDLSHSEPPLSAESIEPLCRHIEALYWRRYRLAGTAAQRIDALINVAEACRRPSALEQTWVTLQADADTAIAEGRHGDAVSYLEVLIDGPRRGVRVPDETIASARETIHRLLWPTYLGNRRDRFERRLASSWSDRGVYDSETESVTVSVEVALPQDCPRDDIATCTTVIDGARTTAFDELARLATEAAEMAAGQVDPRPHLELQDLSLVTSDESSAYFRATVSLETLIRAIYEAEERHEPIN